MSSTPLPVTLPKKMHQLHHGQGVALAIVEERTSEAVAQFEGKRHGARLKLDDDIQNISGATLSCKHIAEGVRRVLALHEAALK